MSLLLLARTATAVYISTLPQNWQRTTLLIKFSAMFVRHFEWKQTARDWGGPFGFAPNFCRDNFFYQEIARNLRLNLNILKTFVRQVCIKMREFIMFITAVCILFLINNILFFVKSQKVTEVCEHAEQVFVRISFRISHENTELWFTRRNENINPITN